MRGDQKEAKRSSADNHSSPCRWSTHPRPSSDNKQYSHEDYDDYSKMVFSRAYVCSQPGSKRQSAEAQTPKDDRTGLIYKKYTEGVETITERSTEFSMQKLSGCTLSKLQDLADTYSASSRFKAGNDSKHNLADINRVSVESVKLDIVQEKEMSHESRDLSEFKSQPQMSEECFKEAKLDSNEVISGTCTITSPSKRENLSICSSIKTEEVIGTEVKQTESCSLKPDHQRQNYAIQTMEYGIEDNGWNSEKFEAPCYIDERDQRKEKWQSEQKALIQEMREQHNFEPDVISLDDESHGKDSSNSLEDVGKLVYQARLSPAGDDSVPTHWPYYDKINSLSTTLSNYTFDSFKSVENLISIIENKSSQIEKLCHKLGSPELRQLEVMLENFAKRRANCKPAARDRFPLIGLGQAELVDAVWSCNTEIIEKYQNSCKEVKGGSSKGPIMNRVVVRHPHILENLTYSNLRTLKPGNWLNDEVINAYLRLVDSDLEMLNPSVRVVNTYFMTDSVCNNLNSAKIMRILSKKRIDVKNLNQLFIPINTNNTHWSFAVIDFVKHSVIYHDSLGGGSTPFKKELSGLATLLNKERGGSSGQFVLASIHPTFPKQDNHIDCGAFMLKGIDELARFGSISFGQADIDYLRYLVCFELLQGKFYQP